MPPQLPIKLSNNHQKQGFGLDMVVISLCKVLTIGAIVFVIFFALLFYYPTCKSEVFNPIEHVSVSPPPSSPPSLPIPIESPTNIGHIVFGILASTHAWSDRQHYTESWWKPNVTRGYLFLDKPPTEDLLPWNGSAPPYRVSEDTSGILAVTHQNDTMVRIARGLLETFREGAKGARWIMMADDDSILFLDNIVDVLRKYDHTKYVYIGGHSESALPNLIHSYDMGFGGAGVIFSYPLAAALVPRLDDCLKRYPQLYAADQMWQSCLSDMGVYLSPEKGLHQIDLRGDLSGFLSAHPQAPLLSLHHPGTVKPYFPNMDRHQSVSHLMKAAKVDQSRLLQQTICYHRGNHWSFSVSWGYSVHVYENIYPRSILQKPLETFIPWVTENVYPPFYRFNTRVPNTDPCHTPHVYYMESIRHIGADQVVTIYTRVAPRGLGTCVFSGNHPADHVFKVRVISPSAKLKEVYSRECCDVVGIDKSNTAEIRYRDCLKDEVIG